MMDVSGMGVNGGVDGAESGLKSDTRLTDLESRKVM